MRALDDLACLRTLGVYASTRLEDGSSGALKSADLQQIAAAESCRSLRDEPLRLIVGAGADEGVWLAVQVDESDSGAAISELRARFCVRGTSVSATRSPSDGLALCVQDAVVATDPEAPARDLDRANYAAEEVDRDIVWADGYYVLRPQGLGGHPTGSSA